MNFCIFYNHVTILILIKTRNEQKTTLKEATHVIKRNKFSYNTKVIDSLFMLYHMKNMLLQTNWKVARLEKIVICKGCLENFITKKIQGTAKVHAYIRQLNGLWNCNPIKEDYMVEFQ